MRIKSMKLPGVLGAVLRRLSPKGGPHMRRFIVALSTASASVNIGLPSCGRRLVMR